MKNYLVIPAILTVSGCSSTNFTPPASWEPISTNEVLKVERSYMMDTEITTTVGVPMMKSAYVKGWDSYTPVVSAIVWRGHSISSPNNRGQTSIWQPTYKYPGGDADYILTAQSFYSRAVGILVNEDGSVPKNPVIRIDSRGSTERLPASTVSGNWFEKSFTQNKKFQPSNYELIYSGKSGSTISLTYREYSGNMIKDAFNQDLKYDLSESKTIQFRTTKIEVIDANNSNIRFKVLSSGNK